MDVETEFKTIKEKVKYLMHKYPHTRDSDMLLFAKYLQEFTHFRIINVLEFDYENVRNSFKSIPDLSSFPNFRTVVRVRAETQNQEKELLPNSEEVREKRRTREKNIKAFYSPI
jgi:outer membrane protein assembly factor BamD (BamD/ComL family)